MSIVVAVTGGIGVGKSLVCEMLGSLGGAIVQADRIGWEVLECETQVKKEIVKSFGDDILKEDGEIDREELAKLVFSNRSKLERLNKIVHPVLLLRVGKAVGKLSAEGHPVIVVDAALVVEWNRVKNFDIIVLVTAPHKERVKRLKGKGMDEKEIIERIESQMSDKEKKKAADFVIENNGTVDELRKKAQELWLRILSGRKGQDGALR